MHNKSKINSIRNERFDVVRAIAVCLKVSVEI